MSSPGNGKSGMDVEIVEAPKCDISAYQNSIERLRLELSEDAALAAAVSRDRLAAELKSFADPSIIQRVLDLDNLLRKESVRLIDALAPNRFAIWRQTISTAPDSWWWRLDEVAAGERSPLWSIASGGLIAISISLLGVVSSRFLSVGPDIAGVLLIVVQAILVVVAGSALTDFASRRIAGILQRVGVNSSRHAPCIFGLALAVFALALTVRLSLPLFARMYNESAYSHQKNRQIGRALIDYQRAISLNPDYTPAHYNLGTAYEDVGDYEKAISEYQTAIKSDPGSYHGLNNLGRLFIAYKKDYFAALNVLTAAAKLNPPEPIVRYTIAKNLGWANLLLKNYDEARTQLNAAIREYQPAAEAHCILAEVHQAQAKSSAALAQWKLCAISTPQDRLAEPAWGIKASEQLKQEEQSR